MNCEPKFFCSIDFFALFYRNRGVANDTIHFYNTDSKEIQLRVLLYSFYPSSTILDFVKSTKVFELHLQYLCRNANDFNCLSLSSQNCFDKWSRCYLLHVIVNGENVASAKWRLFLPGFLVTGGFSVAELDLYVDSALCVTEADWCDMLRMWTVVSL